MGGTGGRARRWPGARTAPPGSPVSDPIVIPLESLSRQELLALRDNARRKGRAQIEALVQRELDRRAGLVRGAAGPAARAQARPRARTARWRGWATAGLALVAVGSLSMLGYDMVGRPQQHPRP